MAVRRPGRRTDRRVVLSGGVSSVLMAVLTVDLTGSPRQHDELPASGAASARLAICWESALVAEKTRAQRSWPPGVVSAALWPRACGSQARGTWPPPGGRAAGVPPGSVPAP